LWRFDDRCVPWRTDAQGTSAPSITDAPPLWPRPHPCRFAAKNDDAALYCDLLINIPLSPLMPALVSDPCRAIEITHSMAQLLGSHRPPERGEVDTVIMWLIAIAKEAADAGELELLETCCSGAFEWDSSWDQWSPQAAISAWISTLAGDAASSVAAMLRQHPGCAARLQHLAHDIRIDHRIRKAVSSV
jgi:hypothetical protein